MTRWWPRSRATAPGAAAGSHVLYDDADVLGCGGLCATDALPDATAHRDTASGERAQDNPDEETLAEIGVVILLFAIGMELALERLRGLWHAILAGGAMQVGLGIHPVARLDTGDADVDAPAVPEYPQLLQGLGQFEDAVAYGRG